MEIFFTDGHELLKEEVSDWGEPLSSAECHLIVYKASRVGPSGFDRFPEGRALVERMLRASMVLSSGLDFIPRLHTDESDLFGIVRKEASPGCVSFASPDSGMQKELEILQHLQRELKKQALLKRHGRIPPPEPQALLRSLFQGGHIDSMPLSFVLLHTSHVCILRWGEFGLHFLSLSRRQGNSIDFVKVAAHELNVALIRVGSMREIPSW